VAKDFYLKIVVLPKLKKISTVVLEIYSKIRLVCIDNLCNKSISLPMGQKQVTNQVLENCNPHCATSTSSSTSSTLGKTDAIYIDCYCIVFLNGVGGWEN